MESDLPIVIVSHQRADRVLTVQALSKVIICVPESQGQEYRKFNKGTEVLTHPDTVKGLVPKRNWILGKFGGEAVMIDDDAPYMGRNYINANDAEFVSKVEPSTAYEIVQQAARTARQLGAYLFGFSGLCDPRKYRALKPFKLQGLILGGCVGFLKGSKLAYNEDLVTDDYWISCLNAYHHRYCFMDERFGFAFKDTFHSPGGMSEIRSLKTEKRDNELLKQYFGSAIQKRGWSPLGTATHEFQRRIVLPY